jgi:protein tyrosine/serine phosphatase
MGNARAEGMVNRGKLRIALIVIAACAAIGGGYAYRHAQRYKHLEVHDTERVYRSAWLEADAMAEVVQTHGLKTVVNLCNPGEMGEERWAAERAAVAAAGAKLVELPMPLEIQPNDPRVIPHVQLLQDPANYPLLVHCQHGVTRTAKFLLLYDVLVKGQEADASLGAMPLFGRNRQNVHVRAFSRNLQADREKLLKTAAADKATITQ